MRGWTVLRRLVWVLPVVVVAAVGVLGSGVLASASVPASADPAGFDAFVVSYLHRTGLPGAAVAIVHGDQVVHLAGYGHDATGRPVTADTPMPIASLSKSVTALAVMQLVEAGRVELDRPVTAYLPAFHLSDGRAARITVRELLNQTSGLSDSSDPAMHAPVAGSLSQAVDQLAGARLASAPGTRWHYQVIEPATGYGIAVLANRGYTVGPNDAETIGRRLLDLTAGRRASVPAPWWRLLDAGLAAATVATVPATVWWVRRARRRRQLIVGGAVATVCIAGLLALPAVGRHLSGGRDITLYQLSYVTPATLTLLAVAALAALAGTVTLAISVGASRGSAAR